MQYLNKSFSVPIDNPNYEKIFGHEKPKVNLVDSKKNPTKLSSYQKNHLYKQAKDLRENLRDTLCTQTECRIPNDRNVDKMIRSEFKNKQKVEYYKNAMKAIGADPKDCDPERLRRR